MSRHAKRMSLLLLALAPCGAAFAQYSPDATMDLGTGYGQTALSQSTLSGTRKIGVDARSSTGKSSTTAARTAQAQSLQQQMARIAPEYKRRVRVDGQASADRWLAQTARALGRRDGQNARQRNSR